MANNRVYYATQQIAFKKHSLGTGGSYVAARGVQSASTTTTFNLEQAYTLGQLAIYQNIEGIPDVEMSLNKVLDGYIPLYCLATADQTDGPQLAKRALARTFVQIGIWDEAYESAGQSSSTAGTFVDFSGLYVSSSSFNFPSDGNFTEDLTLVGNSKIWGNSAATNTGSCTPAYSLSAVAGAFAGNNSSPQGSGGVNRREHILFATSTAEATGNPDRSVLPKDIPGVGANGEKVTAHVSSISISADISREDLLELGAKGPYFKTLSFPLEVSCDIEVTTASGDLINALDTCSSVAACTNIANVSDRHIRIATCEGLRINLGSKNKLASVTYGGGDAGGGNATVTYSYTTFNDYTVIHAADVSASGGSASGSAWWTNRSSYLLS